MNTPNSFVTALRHRFVTSESVPAGVMWFTGLVSSEYSRRQDIGGHTTKAGNALRARWWRI